MNRKNLIRHKLFKVVQGHRSQCQDQGEEREWITVKDRDVKGKDRCETDIKRKKRE